MDGQTLSRIEDLFSCKRGKLPLTYPGQSVGANLKLLKNWKAVFDKDKLTLSK